MRREGGEELGGNDRGDQRQRRPRDDLGDDAGRFPLGLLLEHAVSLRASAWYLLSQSYGAL